MATVAQIYNLVNSITSQSIGHIGVTATDTSTLVALGDSIISSDKNMDAWCKSLVDRIGKTLVSNVKYTAKRRKMFRSAIEYGIVLQKIYTEMPDSVTNQTWVTDDNARKSPFELNLPKVRQYLFTGLNSFEYPISIPDKAFKTAFTSANAMGSFVESIMSALYNAMEVGIEGTENLAVATFISKKYAQKDTFPNGAVNLLHDYNTATNAGLTVSSCLTDSGFLKYASMVINKTVKRMGTFSEVYNNSAEVNGKRVKRFTAPENLCLDVLVDFSTATASYLEADTYHKELVALPNYHEVNYWQSSGTSFSFDDVSAVNTSEAGEPIKGILAFAYDVNAIGTTVENRRTATERNNRGAYTNYFEQADIMYFNDLTENAVVFYIEEV